MPLWCYPHRDCRECPTVYSTSILLRMPERRPAAVCGARTGIGEWGVRVRSEYQETKSWTNKHANIVVIGTMLVIVNIGPKCVFLLKIARNNGIMKTKDKRSENG